ncbi:MAG: hypothetical protein ACYDAL_16755 [Candidatus Dormibacteraceae bacterium]
MEFSIWTELIQQSRGVLHVFLPLLDRGLDAVIHRLTDGEYIPVQVKSRGAMAEGMVEIAVPAVRLVDDRALLIAGLLTDDGLGPMLLVVDEATFKRLAARDVVQGQAVYSAAFSMHPTKATHWLPYLVQRQRLAERVLGAPPPSSVLEAVSVQPGLEPRDRHDQWLGFLGESEVIRRLAENPRLDLFRPFPDLEMVEVLARDNANGRFAGLQVKAAVPARVYGEAHIHVRKASFIPAPTTFVVALAWVPDENRFAEECLVVPTERLVDVAVDGGDRWVLNFHPQSPERTPLDPYRRQLAQLGDLVGQLAQDQLPER